MVREVIDHGNAGDLGADLQPSLYGAETAERLFDGGSGNTLPSRERGGGRGIQRIVLTSQRQGELGEGFTAAAKLPLADSVLMPEIPQLPVRSLMESIPFHGAKCI